MAAQDIVDAIDAAILAIAQGGAVRSYMIEGKSITKYGFDELMSLRQKYATLAAQETSTGGVVYASFQRPN